MLAIIGCSLLAVLLIRQEFRMDMIEEKLDDIIEVKEHVKYTKNDVECLTKNIYYEAAQESYEGKLAVAQVTLNRANNPNFPSTICGVVYQRTLGTCQFSWTCLKNLAIQNKYAWEESELVARKALTQPVLHDIIARSNAQYYHAVYVNPGWTGKVITKIGNHVFYARN